MRAVDGGNAMYSQLVVFSQCAAGRDDEFNDWYTWVHIRDVMRLSPVVMAAQRFERAAAQLEPGGPARYPQKYLAIYETTDPVRMTQDHRPVFTEDMPISSAYAFEDICEAYYDTVASRGPSFAHTPRAAVIVEQIEIVSNAAGFVDWYLDSRLPALTRLPGMLSGCLGSAASHQMFDGPHPQYTALYRTADLARSVAGWRDYSAATPVREELRDSSAVCYRPLIDRLTAIEVAQPSAQARDIAGRKRGNLGDRVHRGAPGFTGFQS